MKRVTKQLKIALVVFFCGLVVFAPSAPVLADSAYPGRLYGRLAFRGYFNNQRQLSGNQDLVDSFMPSSINTVNELVNYLQGLYSSGGKLRTSGALIVQTMLGKNGASGLRTVTNSDWNNLRDRLNYHASYSGGITWSQNRASCGVINSWYMPNHNDVSFRIRDYGPGKDCVDPTIVFRNPSGSIVYELNRRCANPMGDLRELEEPNRFRMTGRTTVNGGNSAQVLPGDLVRFRHSLTNQGPDRTNPATINWRTRNQNNNVVDSGNAGTFGDGQTKNRGAENFRVPASATPGTQYCRRIQFDPRTHNGGTGNSTQRCATVQYDFDLEPRINVTIRDVDGQNVTADGVAEAGYTIEFNYSVRNSGLTESQPVNCTYRQDTHSGYSTNAPTQGFVPPGANCPPPRVFPRNSTTQIAAESLSGGSVSTNTTICRSLAINPATQSGGTESVQACVPVVAKPYSRVFGGDVSVGNGLSTEPGVCSSNNDAAVAGWNRRSPGGFAGAGAQYAVFALDSIRDFSTALGNSGGAPPPRGLAFANTGVPINISNGLFGGEFGSAPCIPDYYSARPGDATSLGSNVNLASLGSGDYSRDGSLTISGSGNVNPNEEIAIYVDGDVFIRSDVRYPGNWNVDSMPLFRLITNGNIYIENGVGELNGIYIAQGSGSSDGVIHTCATSMAPLPLNGNLFDTCNNKLTVNGAFIANQVRLLRTNGTLSQSNAGDTAPGGGAAGEVFNFNPTLWIKQPPAPAGEGGEYDAIIGLPPIL